MSATVEADDEVREGVQYVREEERDPTRYARVHVRWGEDSRETDAELYRDEGRRSGDDGDERARSGQAILIANEAHEITSLGGAHFFSLICAVRVIVSDGRQHASARRVIGL